MALEVKQPGNLADNDVVLVIAELFAQLAAMLVRREERLDIHAAVDRRKFVARRNAGCDH